MKRTIYKIVTIALLTIGSSCTPDYEINQDLSKISPEAGVVYSVDVSSFGTTVNVNESEETKYEYIINLNKPQVTDVIVPIKLVNATATEGVDFNFDHTVTIPAGSTSATGSIEVLSDLKAEGDEFFTLQIGGDQATNVTGVSQKVTFNLADFMFSGLVVDFSWSGEATVDYNNSSTTYDLSEIDFDCYVYDESGSVVGKSETGSNPERVVLTGLADGTYTAKALLYESPFSLGDNVKVDVNATFIKPGYFYTNPVMSDPSQYFTTSDADKEKTITTFTVKDGIYTILSATGDVVAEGKQLDISKDVKNK